MEESIDLYESMKTLFNLAQLMKKLSVFHSNKFWGMSCIDIKVYEEYPKHVTPPIRVKVLANVNIPQSCSLEPQGRPVWSSG